ncbi:MAG: glycosyltransferase [Anaerolineae bacterium]|nr:glycosyltransferase [Anaerolineae bacterium]
MSAKVPAVAVVLPVFNAERYLAAAIDSILAQTFTDFELLLLNDGSSDGSAALIDDYARRDGRIRALHLPNRGQSATLNEGLRQARAPLVAIMHADDVSLPERLAQQVACLAAQPDVALVGTWARFIGEQAGTEWHTPVAPDEIAAELLFTCCLIHPTVMLRRAELAAAGLWYADDLRTAQDYDLWLRAVQRLRAGNVPQVLLHYRVHADQVSFVLPERMRQEVMQIQSRQFLALGLSPLAADLLAHEWLHSGRYPATRASLRQIDAWLQKLLAANRARGVYPAAALEQVIAGRWFFACRASATLGPWAWWQYQSSPLSRGMPPAKRLKLLLRCLLRRPPED